MNLQPNMTKIERKATCSWNAFSLACDLFHIGKPAIEKWEKGKFFQKCNASETSLVASKVVRPPDKTSHSLISITKTGQWAADKGHGLCCVNRNTWYRYFGTACGKKLLASVFTPRTISMKWEISATELGLHYFSLNGFQHKKGGTLEKNFTFACGFYSAARLHELMSTASRER